MLETLSVSTALAKLKARQIPRPWRRPRVRRLKLALQGGGAHGAFTWGVLDRLLEEERIEIEGISGTSAGAVNAVAMAHGLVRSGRDDGRQAARTALTRVWRRVSEAAALTPLQPSLLDRALGFGSLDYSPGYWLVETLSRVAAPHQLNLLDLNPLRRILSDEIDFEALRHQTRLRLFIGATDIKRCRLKVFEGREIGVEAVLASTCLPYLYPAVEIGEEAYWDGGYTGNPAILPLVQAGGTRDILVIQLGPGRFEDVPRTARAILDRLNALTFNAGLARELQVLHRVGGFGLARPRLRLHLIEDPEALSPLGSTSKLNAEWSFLEHLRDLGRQRADEWLGRHLENLGRRGTMDLATLAAR